jgi:hypothetical protein
MNLEGARTIYPGLAVDATVAKEFRHSGIIF